MFTKKGEATLTVLILGVLAVSLISVFSNSYTGMDTLNVKDKIKPVVTPTCTDTDPNNDVYIKGEVKVKASGVGVGYLLADVCSGSKRVKERICKTDGKPSYLTKLCPNNKKCIRAKGICQK